MKAFLIIFFTVQLISYTFSANAQSTKDELVNPSVADTNIILPPAWAFGVLYGGYTDQAGTIDRIQKIQEHNYPIEAFWIDSWFWSYADKGIGPKKYIDFVADTSCYPNRKNM
jgi:hypothetical protein